MLTGTKPKAAPPGGGQAYHEEGEPQPDQEEHGPHDCPTDHVGSRPGLLVKQLRGQDPCHSGWKEGKGQGTASEGPLPCPSLTLPQMWEWGPLGVPPEALVQVGVGACR